MSDSNVRELPSNITLDLDAEQRPESEVKPPFAVKINDRVITMEDPANLDWRDLILLDDPTQFLRLALSPEDRKYLLNQDNVPGWKFNRFMEAYYAHYELDEKVAKARRQQALGG